MPHGAQAQHETIDVQSIAGGRMTSPTIVNIDRGPVGTGAGEQNFAREGAAQLRLKACRPVGQEPHARRHKCELMARAPAEAGARASATKGPNFWRECVC